MYLLKIGFSHGTLCDSYEKQANKQGFTLGDRSELFDKIGFSYNLLRVRGYLTDNQADMVLKKIQNDLVKSLKRIS